MIVRLWLAVVRATVIVVASATLLYCLEMTMVFSTFNSNPHIGQLLPVAVAGMGLAFSVVCLARNGVVTDGPADVASATEVTLFAAWNIAFLGVAIMLPPV